MTRFAWTIVDDAPAVLNVSGMLMIGALVAIFATPPFYAVMAAVNGGLAVAALGLLAHGRRLDRRKSTR